MKYMLLITSTDGGADCSTSFEDWQEEQPTVALSVAAAFREERGRLLAALVHRFGDLDLAEDAASEAIEAALTHWPVDGVPPRPGAWLMTTARRRAVDRLRRDRTYAARLAVLAVESERAAPTPAAAGADAAHPRPPRCPHRPRRRTGPPRRPGPAPLGPGHDRGGSRARPGRAHRRTTRPVRGAGRHRRPARGGHRRRRHRLAADRRPLRRADGDHALD